MGLTKQSKGANQSPLTVQKQSPQDHIIALAGNPNVGKSTVFNALTGMNQHTGNWPGKTVTNAQGYCRYQSEGFVLVDLPGTYSLLAHSAEEAAARDFLCFGEPDSVVVVCDATCLERNLNLVLQTMEISPKVVVCVNLLDEAKRKHIRVDLAVLSRELGVPVVGTVARKKRSLQQLLKALDTKARFPGIRVQYPQPIENAIQSLSPVLESLTHERIPSRWLSLRLLDPDESLLEGIRGFLGKDILQEETIRNALEDARKALALAGISDLQDSIVSSLVQTAEEIASKAVKIENSAYNDADRKIDSVLTSRWAGYPIMLFLLAGIFWLTITGANYPSKLLSYGLFWVQDRLRELFVLWNAPDWMVGLLIDGLYRVLACVISVMLPPMAIFFPLFTLLEDVGYLPRIAYNLDKPFQRCAACGKQSLTMCMGFGCNAAGIVGCRIIDSPRERMIAVLTNSFVPCNGRFPALIAVLTMFFVGTAGGFLASVQSALMLTMLILLGIGMTFAVSKILSMTILKGIPSSFTLEMPPYRRPQVGRVILRSIFDRTLFVLGRSAAVAAPAGIFIWLMANLSVNGTSLLQHCAAFLDPFGRLLGMDGVIILAFLLGLPANEIVIPIILMAYMQEGTILQMESLTDMKALLLSHGWTELTAISVMLFFLMHWPCSTTLLTIRKETGSWKWTVLAFLIPTVTGIALCFCFTQIAGLFS